jgi:hypothetical protein
VFVHVARGCIEGVLIMIVVYKIYIGLGVMFLNIVDIL